MDNLTHTLAGALIGECLSRASPAARSCLAAPQRRGLLITLSVACSNLPDADLLYTMVAGGKLDYLSQHRGYSHTLLGVAVAAALVALAVQLWLRWRQLKPTRSDLKLVLAAAGMSLLVHLALDYSNNYGVHPFWPVHNHWLYGDAVFIIEPLLWTCAAPLIFLWRSRFARALVALVLAAGLGLAFGTKWIAPASAVAMSLLMLLLLYAGWKGSARTALTSAVVAWLAVTATFFAGSELAARGIARALAERYPDARLLDRVLTPMPANPLCWNVIAVTLEGEHFALRRAVLSALPELIAASACPDRSLDAATSAPLRRIAATGSPALLWLDEYRVARSQFARVLQAYCEAAIFMHFARAPWIANQRGGWTIGDLRYDREPEPGFAELELPQPRGSCGKGAPPWVPPRGELATDH